MSTFVPNKAQSRFMRFCMEYPAPHIFEWRSGGGEAEGPPENWDRFRVKRHARSKLFFKRPAIRQCTISKTDLLGIPKKCMRTFKVTAAGRRALEVVATRERARALTENSEYAKRAVSALRQSVI